MRKLLYVAVLVLLSVAGLGAAAANCPACALCSGQQAACCQPGTCPGQ